MANFPLSPVMATLPRSGNMIWTYELQIHFTLTTHFALKDLLFSEMLHLRLQENTFPMEVVQALSTSSLF